MASNSTERPSVEKTEQSTDGRLSNVVESLSITSTLADGKTTLDRTPSIVIGSNSSKLSPSKIVELPGRLLRERERKRKREREREREKERERETN